MKHFKKIKEWFDKQEHLFYWFLMVLIVPNVVLCFTEPMPLTAKVCNVLLPFACYYILMTLSRNCGKIFWILFPFIFLGAFQIVLLYLFGKSIIAVDMFLNLATTNSSEALELLDNLIPAIVIVVVLYIPALIFAMTSIIRKRLLTVDFIRRERKRAVWLLIIGGLSLTTAYVTDSRYELRSDLYPVNVCYNVVLAFQRDAKTREYDRTSKDFTFRAKSVHPQNEREIYVLVVGETSRALNWQLYGYEKDTNPELSKISNLTVFTNALTQSNTTHKSVPMLMSGISSINFDSIYYQKGIITAFKEAGFQTVFLSNQRRNHSFIDFLGMEADTYNFIKEDSTDSDYNPSDDELLKLMKKELEKGVQKQFIVLHTYGSHFNYRERYPQDKAVFMPDTPVDAEYKNRSSLLNAYDNTIRYTDDFLSRLIRMLKAEKANSAMLFTSDHGEDIFDDSRHLFLHASPVPSYYQLHVPLLVWTSDNYHKEYPERIVSLIKNRRKLVATSSSVFHSLLELGGIQTSYRQDSLSVASSTFKEVPFYYLNDHNEPCLLGDLGMGIADFQMFRQLRLRH